MMLQTLRDHKILSSISILLLLFVFLMTLIVLFAEPIIKSFTEDKGSEKLKRQLVIDGAFYIHWHWIYTEIHAEKIRISNAPGYPDANILTIDTLNFTFKPLKLFLGRLEFGDIFLYKSNLILDRKSAREFNWNFPIFSLPNAASQATLPDNPRNFPLLQTLELDDGHLIYNDAVRGMNLDIKVDSLKGDGGDKNPGKKSESAFRISGTGSMQKKQFTIVASGGSLDTLRDSTKEYPFDIKLVMGSTHLIVVGTVKDKIKLTGINASLKISGHSMADLFYLTAIPLPPTPPYTLDGQLTKVGDVWGYKDFKGEVGGSDLSGDLSYDTGGERGFLKANLVSNSMDSRDWGGFIGLPPSGENAAPEQKKEAAEKKASAKLIPDVPLNLERLRASDLDVTLRAAKINAPGLPFKGMEVRFDLHKGLLKLNPLNVVLADGTIDGAIEIDAQKDIPPMKMDLNFHRLSLNQFFIGSRFEHTTEGYFGGKANLSGVGASLAQVLATSNGKITLIMSGGKISLLLIEASDLDIAQALPLFLGKDKSTKIRCAVTDFDVKDGFLASKIAVIDTNDSLLVGNVSIDMKREVISAKLDAKPKDSSIFSLQIPITVSGKLKAPSVGIDVKKAEKKGTAAIVLGSLLTPLAAIIPFIEKGEAQNIDCRTLIDRASK